MESWFAVEKETRTAIKAGGRTIAYIAIGAEQHEAVIVAAPRMLAALRIAERFFCNERDNGGKDARSVALRTVREAISAATSSAERGAS